jgi:acetate CoA/acetoacetate CoA-transferase alpha subunit
MKKAISLADTVKMIPNHASLMIGGFVGIGSPHRIIDELVRQKRSGLTIIANDTGVPISALGC